LRVTPAANPPFDLHTYPCGDHPDDKASAVHRMRCLRALVDPICVRGGKPCWITECGFAYASKACPASERCGSLGETDKRALGSF